MDNYSMHLIKSFKHDGSVHRTWLENWMVPKSRMREEHLKEEMVILINDHTIVRESNGHEWVSRMPGISYFIPKQWFNVVALLEESGVRYYCNVASPMYLQRGTLTYIDYDLDVIVLPDGEVRVVDRDEFEENKAAYRYSKETEQMAECGLLECLSRIDGGRSPFQDDAVIQYYTDWRKARQS